MISRLCSIGLLIVLLSTIGTQASADTLAGRYFMVIYGSQVPGGGPTLAHTFAAFYRGDDLAKGSGGAAAISWMPATGIVRPHGEERGRNMSLGETLRLAHTTGATIQTFGPYEIKAELYQKALARIRFLGSGQVQYTMINHGGNAINCIKALGEIGGPISTGFRYGPSASAAVASHLSSWIVNYPQVSQTAASRLRIGSGASSHAEGPGEGSAKKARTARPAGDKAS